MITDYIGVGINLLKQGLSIVRNLMGQAIGLTGFSPSLGVTILMAIASLLLGYVLVKKFVSKISAYFGWYLLISFIIFLILGYL